MYVGACVETSGDNLSKSAPPSTTQGPQLELRSSGFSADSWIHWAISPAWTLKKAKQRPKVNGIDGMLCERVEGWLEGWASAVGSEGRAGVKGIKRLLRALPTSLGFCWVVGWLLIVWWIFFLFYFNLFVTQSLTLEPSMTSNLQQLSSCDLRSARIEGVSHRSGSDICWRKESFKVTD